MLTPHKERIRRLTESAARVFAQLGVSPNALTAVSLFMGLATCVFFVWNRNPIIFACLMILWGVFDLFDGALARLTHQTSRFGAYLDAMADRIFEAAAVLVAAHVSGYWLVSFVLIVGAMLMSYAKARAAIEIPVVNNEWPDFMERLERDVFFAMSLMVWGIVGGERGLQIFFWLLVVLTVMVYGGLIQRFLRARRLIIQRSSQSL
jgi:archaetidylinositol phosphate synthase